MNKFKMQFMGCPLYCPLCRRQCDKQHNVDQSIEQTRHECESGHQIQSFGGSYNQDDKLAVTISCCEIRNNDQVNYEGDVIKWIVFKEKPILRNWFYDVEKDDQAINREKNVKIWNLLGQKICTLYNNDGNPIRFQEAIPQILLHLEQIP